MILTVTEHEKIYIGKTRQLSQKQISRSDVEAIRVIDINGKGIFRWGNRYIIPQQWVGVISLPGLSIEILPKVAGSYQHANIKEILLYMFNVGHDIPNKRNIKAMVDFSKNGLIEILISNYLEKIEFYIREGFISSYNKVVRNISTVKGSILFSNCLNKNVFNPTRFVCKYSKLEVNNDVNKLLKYTLFKMKINSRDYENIKKLNTALLYFENVSSISSKQYNDIKIQINANNSRISEIIEYSYFFLNGYSVSLSGGNKEISSMLFDMNKIFELFIYKSYKKIFGSRILYQNGKNYLLTDFSETSKKIHLKPDILIKTKEGKTIVVDTKWKETRTFAKESDVYQMNAYVSAIPNVDTALLMYPKTTNSSSIVGNYKFNHESKDKVLKIRVVDLTFVQDEKKFKAQLIDLLA